MSDKVSALVSTRSAWNPFRALFNPAIVQVAAVPDLKPVYDVLKAMADVGISGAPVIKKAIEDAGVASVDPLSDNEKAIAKKATDELTAILRAFETKTGFKVLALTVERSADGTLTLGDITAG